MAQLRPDDASAAFTAFFDDVLFDDDRGESFVFFFDAGDAGDFAIAFGPFDGAVGVEGPTFSSSLKRCRLVRSSHELSNESRCWVQVLSMPMSFLVRGICF